MKAFSRKALATAAAAGFVTAGAFAAPAMAQEPSASVSPAATPSPTATTTVWVPNPSTSTVTTPGGKVTSTVTSPMTSRPFNEASSGPEGEDGKGRFEEWMKLVTAIIGILTAVIGLASQAGKLFM